MVTNRTQSRRGMATGLLTTGIGIALIFACALTPRLRATQNYSAAYVTSEGAQHEINTSAFAMILGEVRTSLSDFIWVKSELYEHRGMRFAAHKDEDKDMEQAEVTSESKDEHEHEHGHADDHEKHDHDKDLKSALMIPAPERDFRGFIGDIQREIEPWGEHQFARSREVLPWYRVQTAINPRHARAYVVAGYLLMHEENTPGHLEQAIAFLDEGIKNNPDHFQLYLMKGRVLIKQEKWNEAIEEFRRSRDVGLKFRPALGELSPTWTQDDEDEFAFTIRYIPFLQLRKLHDREAARKSTAEGLKLKPRDAPLANFMQEIEKSQE